MLISSGISGAGLGTAYAAMPALIMRAVPIAQTGEANGVNALMRVIGTSTSAALVGTILTWSMVTVLGTNGQPTRVPDVAGYLTAAIISLAACVAAALVALAIPAQSSS